MPICPKDKHILYISRLTIHHSKSQLLCSIYMNKVTIPYTINWPNTVTVHSSSRAKIGTHLRLCTGLLLPRLSMATTSSYALGSHPEAPPQGCALGWFLKIHPGARPEECPGVTPEDAPSGWALRQSPKSLYNVISNSTNSCEINTTSIRTFQ